MLPALSQAQQCNGFYYLQANKKITMSLTDRKGRPSGSYVYTVSDVKSNGPVMSSKVRSEMFDESGKSVSSSECIMKCNGGTYQMDMKMLLPQQQAEQFKNMDAQTEFYLDYPAVMNTGEVLKEGTFNTNVTNDKGLEMSLEMTITDRNVLAQEQVTTAAGTWQAFKISSRCKVRTRISGIGIPFTIEQTEWFVPSFGVVKTQSKWGGTEITAIQ